MKFRWGKILVTAQVHLVEIQPPHVDGWETPMTKQTTGRLMNRHQQPGLVIRHSVHTESLNDSDNNLSTANSQPNDDDQSLPKKAFYFLKKSENSHI